MIHSMLSGGHFCHPFRRPIVPDGFSKMVEEHLERGADVTVAAKPVAVSDASGLGLLR